MAEFETYEGNVEEVIYYNETNSYSVFEFFDGKAKYFTCVGSVPYIKAGELLRITGTWVIHHDYGEQFKLSSFEKLEPTSTAEILTYLSSGVVKGIRAATAKKIVDYFGKDTLRIIDSTPERLAEIPGISLKKAISMGEAYENIKSKEELIIFLHRFGISTNFAVKIYDKFGEDAVPEIKKNPYMLCESLRGVSFKTADEVAKSLGISESDENRIKAGIKYVLLYAAYTGGHTYLPRKLLLSLAVKMLASSDLAVENGIVALLISKELENAEIQGEEGIFLPEFFDCERNLAENIKRKVLASESDTKKIEKIIEKTEKQTGIILAEEQKRAVITAASAGITVITGGPGTGKTTTIKFIIDVFKEMGKKIALAAPTGRAAKRMSSVTGMEAKTIHRLLEIGYSDDELVREFVRCSDFPLESNVIIVDEVSMIDLLLMGSLMMALKASAKIILVGDCDQLPSVGAGNVLSDVITSKTVPVIELNTVFRQAEQSMIVVNAHRINSGDAPEYNVKGKDFFFVDESGAENIAHAVCDLVAKRLPKAYGYDPVSDIQVISPMKKTVAGSLNLNKLLQELINPPGKHKKQRELISRVLREGDKVMQIKNNYDLAWKKLDGSEEGTGVFNGDMGYIEQIDEDEISVILDDDKRVIYKSNMTDELELSYAVTVHKSQGSEFPVIVMPVFSGAPRLMSRNLLYTAITRASKLVVLVGSRLSVQKMIDNDFEEYRYSSLAAWLKN